jgi:hypothetical protein
VISSIKKMVNGDHHWHWGNAGQPPTLYGESFVKGIDAYYNIESGCERDPGPVSRQNNVERHSISFGL